MANDFEGIPDVDLGPVIKSLQETGVVEKTEQKPEHKTEPQQQGQGEPQEREELDLGQFKNPKDLLKSYKEIQAAFTRVTQENKLTKQQLSELKESLDLAQAAASRQPQFPQQQKKFDDAFIENPEAAIQQQIAQQVMTTRIAEVLEEEADKSKDDFNERYAYAQQVARQYPQLATSPAGVRKLFQFGDKLRQDALKKNASKALESIFGEPLAEEEINKLRHMVKGDKAIKKTNNNIQDAYMPDTSTSTRTGADPARKTNETDIDERASKGDVDGTIAAIFNAALAE